MADRSIQDLKLQSNSIWNQHLEELRHNINQQKAQNGMNEQYYDEAEAEELSQQIETIENDLNNMQMAYSQTDCLNDLHQQIQNQNIQSEQFQMQV